VLMPESKYRSTEPTAPPNATNNRFLTILSDLRCKGTKKREISRIIRRFSLYLHAESSILLNEYEYEESHCYID
jgi:hypothetical protein